MTDEILKKQALSLVQSLLRDQIVTPQELARFLPQTGDPQDPEYICQEMERWYRMLGIEEVIGRPLTLSRPPFTSEELVRAYEQEEMVLCVPKGVTRQQLGTLFHLSSWALQDDLVADATEVEDFWFMTKRSLTPEGLNKSGTEVQRLLEDQGMLGMSLSRYMTFVARMRYTTGQTPDYKYWVWMTRGRYDQKSMLIAGFDAQHKFSTHAWLPHFQGGRCGMRYVKIADHL